MPCCCHRSLLCRCPLPAGSRRCRRDVLREALCDRPRRRPRPDAPLRQRRRRGARPPRLHAGGDEERRSAATSGRRLAWRIWPGVAAASQPPSHQRCPFCAPPDVQLPRRHRGGRDRDAPGPRGVPRRLAHCTGKHASPRSPPLCPLGRRGKRLHPRPPWLSPIPSSPRISPPCACVRAGHQGRALDAARRPAGRGCGRV